MGHRLSRVRFRRGDKARISSSNRLAIIVNDHFIDQVILPPGTKEFSHKGGIYVLDDGEGMPYADGAIFLEGCPNPIKLQEGTDGVIGDAQALDRVVSNRFVGGIQNDVPDPVEGSIWDVIEDAHIKYTIIASVVLMVLIMVIIYV